MVTLGVVALPHESVRRGYAPPIHEQLFTLPRLSPAEQSSAIQCICDQLRERVLSEDVVPSDIPNPYGIPWFFMFRDELRKAIADPGIRSLTG